MRRTARNSGKIEFFYSRRVRRPKKRSNVINAANIIQKNRNRKFPDQVIRLCAGSYLKWDSFGHDSVKALE